MCDYGISTCVMAHTRPVDANCWIDGFEFRDVAYVEKEREPGSVDLIFVFLLT